ncbi:MAG TPA: hydroxyacylglutathione hydrolase [Haliangiales bacterium]|nr:hydroxyacylglutathione hydrolase [Haliangiales bacterium]
MLAVHWVRALKDNYIYVLAADGEAAVVDPGEAAPAEAALARLGVRLRQIWCTHHHWDHTNGAAELAARHGAEVLAGEADAGKIAAATRRLADGERFDFAGHSVETIAIPAHTLGQVAFYVDGNVFPGDTLFGAGCGRLFEGTPEMMVRSLGRLRALPDATKIWCGHEYTLHNLRFAVGVGIEPDNAALRARYERVAAAPDAPTIPLSLVEERATNPFLRWDAPGIRRFAGADADVPAFAAVRRTKDQWRG